MTPTQPADLLFAVLGVQLGYLAADDVLAAGRDVGGPGEPRSLCELLVARGVLDRARAQVIERLASRAASTTGGDAKETLQLLPSAVRELARATSEESSRPSTTVPPRVGLVEEQAHRYFAAPRADAPPQELGAGGVGRVVAMHDTVIGRDVAWKQALVPDEANDSAIAAQARMLARLDHPAVVPVYELGKTAAGTIYVTMRRVPGDSLADAITRATGIDERLALLPALHTIARCLVDAHERGVTHRRLACERVSLGRFGEVYVHGWGWPDPDMSEADSQAADVKALGAILHEVVTGLPPPVMGTLEARGAPADLVDLYRQTLAGKVTTTEHFANELKAWLDGRRLAGYRYSSLQLLTRWVQRHRVYTAMLVTGAVLALSLGVTGAQRVREERDRSRVFARRFLDDVALRLRAQPGVEPLLEQVTGAALSHYQRTTDLRSAPREERLRVARAMARFGVISQSLGRSDEAQRSLDFADQLASRLAEREDEAEARVILSQTAAARALLAGDRAEEATRWAERSRVLADEAVALQPELFDARHAAAQARLLPGQAQGARLDEAVALLERPATTPEDELQRAQALAAALVARLEWRARSGKAPSEDEVREAGRTLEALRQSTPDDLELQLAIVRASLLLAETIEVRSVDEARVEATTAARLAREVLHRREDRDDVALLAVRAMLRAGQATESLALARRFSRVEGMGGLLAEAAFFSGDAQAAREAVVKSPEPHDVLVRALAAAWLERPSDAVIQARALKADIDEVKWPRARLAGALAVLPQGNGGGEASVRRFGEAWKERGPDAALAEWIAALEGMLTK